VLEACSIDKTYISNIKAIGVLLSSGIKEECGTILIDFKDVGELQRSAFTS
jgi:hypothetical protein